MSDTNSNALIPLGVDAAQVRHAAAVHRANMLREQAALEERVKKAKADMEAQRRALEAEFARQRAELEAQIAPMREQLARLTEVAWTADLYLGRDEDLTLIRDGAPAPEGTPITIRQRVLVMAEESLLLMDRKDREGMDYRDINTFTRWLTQDPANLDRLLPEPKGVVVLVPTRVESRTGNIWEDAAKDAANQTSYWLLRNGERLHVLTVDPDLKVGQRLLPRRTEFTDVFDQTVFGRPIEPGSDRWLKLERAADARRRHYMRIMLVLQGILDRTTIWHPLPAAGINLLSTRAQDDGHVVLIQDDDVHALLTDGRESFGQWQARLNALLRPGVRVIGDWGTRGFRDLYIDGDRYSRGHHPRIHPGNAPYPPANAPHLIEDRRDGGFVIRYARTDEVWKPRVPIPDRPGYVYRGLMPTTPTTRASCVIKTTDQWVLPFDLASEADLTYYLNSRTDRSRHFLTMVPVIRAALTAKQTERATEAPFRGLLASMLVTEGADEDTVDALVTDLIHDWKVANTWARPLNGDPKHEAKAARQIIATYRSTVASQGDSKAERMVKAGRSLEGCVAVGRTRAGQWNAYLRAEPAHDPGVWLHVAALATDGTVKGTQHWKAVPARSISALTIAWEHDDWATWKHSANPRHYLTGPERDTLIAQMRDLLDGTALCVTEYWDPARPADRYLTVYSWTADQSPADLPPQPFDSPLSWRHRATSPVKSLNRKVIKDATGLALGDARRNLGDRDFDSFDSGTRWGSTPWWPDTATRYGDARPRLVWADEDALDAMKGWVDTCKAAAKEAHAARAVENDTVYRYVRAIADVIEAAQVAAIRERFDIDYPGADDLWEKHLATQKNIQPIRDRDLWALIAIARRDNISVEGATLGSLADHAVGKDRPGEWHGNVNARIGLQGHDNLIVPALDPKD